MPDFSHFQRMPLWSFLAALDDGREPSAEFFDHLLDRIEPPLFEELRTQALRAELCSFAKKPYRSRPPKGHSRAELAAAVRSIRRPDVPQELLACLASVLDRKPPADRFAAPRRLLEQRRRRTREATMRTVHSMFVNFVEHGTEPPIPLLADRAKQLQGSKYP